LRVAVERGEIKAIHPLPDGPWIFRRQDLEQPAIYRIVQRVRKRAGHPAKPNPEQQNLGFSST
jgi:hypothetical protein